MFNLRQLKAFVTVAEQGSFTRAAKLLYMTQPAVSAQIKALEERLEIQLLERHDKNVILTDAGEMLLTEARKMLSLYEAFMDAVDELKGVRRGKLVIGASTIPGEYILPRVIGSFKKEYPHIEVMLKISDTGKVADQLLDRGIDIGIIGAAIKNDNLDLAPFITDELILVAATEHPLAKKKKVTTDDILKSDFILREPGSGTRMVIETVLAPKNVRPSDLRVIMELGSTRAVITAVEAGLGASLVSRLAAQEALRLQRIKEIKADGWRIERSLYLALNKTRYRSYAAEAFISHLLNYEKKV